MANQEGFSQKLHQSDSAGQNADAESSMLGSDLDFWGHATLAVAFTLGMLALITMVVVLGLVALYSWEAEWFLRSSFFSFSSRLFLN